MECAQAIAQFKSLRAAGNVADGLRVLKEALRRGLVDDGALDQFGRLILRHADSLPTQPPPLSVLILGQCTTSWLIPALTAIAWGRGRAITVREGGYDNIIQDLAAVEAKANATGNTPDAIVLLPWRQRLAAADDRSPSQRISDELAFLRHAWDLVRRTGSRLIQVGFDHDHAGALGSHLSAREEGFIHLVRSLNEQVRQSLPQGAFFVDLEQVSGEIGRRQFYDPRSYFWTKQPFGRAGVKRLCEYLWAGIAALTTGPKKVLVLDLDNTLWGGVVGELGAQGVGLLDDPDGEAFRAFQKEIKGLAGRGVVLAVCSKNNPQDAREVFEKNPNMVLKLADFAAFEASWDPKPHAIQRIAKTLRLGLDSFVFFDDNPAEREFVRQALPEVEVVDVPPDPADYVRALYHGLWFESAAITEADRARVEQYRDERQRREAEQTAGSVEAYLESLKMVADVRPLDGADMDRAVQLLAKTNQFNLTSRRHTADIVRSMLTRPKSLGITLRLADRFGDAGLVALILGVPLEDASIPTLWLDTWLMSCRVIARTVEEFSINYVVARAKELGYQRLLGEFIPTAKNQLVADLYDRLGFIKQSEAAGGITRYILNLADYKAHPSPIMSKGI